MAEDSSYRPAVYRKQGGNTQVVGGTGVLEVYGEIMFGTGSKVRKNVVNATAAQTLGAHDSGAIVVTKVKDLTHSIPSATNGSGLSYSFILATGALSTGDGLKVSSGGGMFYGLGLTSHATGKDLNLPGATDYPGDHAEVISDGTDWAVYRARGNWTFST